MIWNSILDSMDNSQDQFLRLDQDHLLEHQMDYRTSLSCATHNPKLNVERLVKPNWFKELRDITLNKPN